MLLVRFVSADDHRHPQPRQSSSSAELKICETSFGQERGKRLSAPQFDMPTIPQWIGMAIPMIAERNHQIFKIAMIWCGADETAARL